MTTSSKRDQLVDMAIEVFFRNGCHTTGIDKLLAQAGVAKMTLYAHFKSKEDLILAAAERLHERELDALKSFLEDQNLTPAQRLHATYDHLEQFINNSDFAGCPFQNVAVEFSDPKHPIHRVAAKHKQEAERLIADALTRAGAKDSVATARRMMLLSEGAKAMVQVTGDHSYVDAARTAGHDLLIAALP